jgi:hypothetical protein
MLFAIAYTQSPLYYSNQNQYFLHGLADGGYGHLANDWLANTADPTPIFSAFVSASYRSLGEWPFQAVFFGALVAYFLILWHLVAAIRAGMVGNDNPTSAFFFLWATAITLSHAGPARWASDRLFGADYLWFIQCGLANQYVLGPGLQPSVIGVLLLAAVAAYATGRPVLAAALAAGANWVHATYLLPTAMLVVGFMAGELARNRAAGLFPALSLGVVALLLAAPVVAFNLWQFGPSDPATFADAQRILAEIRIPHHARPARWFDAAGGFQVIWIVLGLLALWRTRLFAPLAVAAALAAAGTGIVLATDDPTVELLFPWRVSAVLTPVATAAIAARSAEFRARSGGLIPRSALRAPRSALIAVSCLLSLSAAAVVYGFHLGYREPQAEDPALDFVQGTAAPGDVYLVPARFPKPATERGVYSATFAPPPNPEQPVYFEMARFRLATGAALYIDFKSIPYKDADVLEWHRRVANCVRWFGRADWDTGMIAELRREGVTHVVAPTKLGLNSEELEPVFEGGAYRVYRVR